MKIFLSWSGEASHQVALALRDWLGTVLPATAPWISSEDISEMDDPELVGGFSPSSNRRRGGLPLILALAAIVASLGAGEAADAHEDPPRTIDEALDGLETLLSPEALSQIHSSPEEKLVEFESGTRDILRLRWLNVLGKHPPSLASALRARRVDPADDAAYLLTALWHRQKGLPIDRRQPLQVVRRVRRIHADAVARQQRALPRGSYRFDCCGADGLTINGGQFHFLPDTAVLKPGQEALLDRISGEIQRTTGFLLVEAQGHAAAAEQEPDALSLARARSLVAILVQRGIAPARLTSYGLGTRFPARVPEICPAGTPWSKKVSRGGEVPCVDDTAAIRPAGLRDQRVDLVVIRRQFWPGWNEERQPG